MKSPVELTICVLTDVGTLCGVCTTQDKKTILRRAKNEGDSFCTITLADFGKDLQECLDQGSVSSHHFCGFSRSGGLPRFLGGFLELVFDRESGMLLPEPDVAVIQSIFQVCFFTSKIQRPCSDARTLAAFRRYMLIEDSVRQHEASMSEDDHLTLSHAARVLFWEPLTRVQDDLLNQRLIPKHGPGATAERLTGNRKFQHKTWPARLEREFPALEFILPNARYHQALDGVRYLEPEEEIPVRVISVPKTLRTPRIIAIEPVAMQYVQQALMAPLVSYLERDNLLSGMIGFTDQTPNQRMACEGSRDGSLATLDLSDASDRVGNSLVSDLFAYHPLLGDAVQACRSRRAVTPIGSVNLSKFASMGSALTFPMEAMVFLAIIFIAISECEQQPLDRSLVKRVRSKVRVYGDDIIVPVEYAESVASRLEDFGLAVNWRKSFWTGKFRESCGAEFFNGEDVTVVRQRQEVCTSRTRVAEVESTVALRNLLYWRGLWGTARVLDEAIVRVLPHFPIVEDTSVVLGRESVFSPVGEREDPYLHKPLVKGFVRVEKAPLSRIDGVDALTKCLLKQSGDPYNVDHLERAGRPDKPYLKIRWKAPF